MGYIFVLIYMLADLWLYVKGARPENSIWKDEVFRWM